MAELKKPQPKEETQVPIPELEPGAHYVWSPEAEFVLTGAEYELLFNALKANFRDPVFAAHIDQFQAYKMLENVFLEGIKTGVVTKQQNSSVEELPVEEV